MDTKILLVGCVIGLLVGSAAGYTVSSSGTNTLKGQVDSLTLEKTSLQNQLSTLQYQLNTKTSEVNTLNGQITSKDSTISSLQNQVTTSDSTIAAQQATITTKNNQIADLQTQVNTLNTRILTLQGQSTGNLQSGKWNIIKTFTGSSSLSTDYFNIPTSDIRVNWTYAQGSMRMISYYGYKQGASSYDYAFYNVFIQNGSGSSVYHNLAPGNYYLEVSQANIPSWKITIESWVP
ncbi:MAG: hypothetical protein NTV61_04110 [Candidatus Bathyarchaeota archaeon]|nr:hypothetical protein [Candidatus Bathyarchaeota archaeon]